ncbi:MAG: DUF503 domain-containing protein [Armatimonadetes bacterium]|nr:DUF503 domain-containing protein [Armatimonadota bacterium]
MTVGVCKLNLYLLDKPDSLKTKRQILRKIKEQIKNKFEVCISEVDGLNLWQRTVLGIVCATPDKIRAEQILNKIICFLDKNANIEIINCYLDFLTI